MDESLVEAFPKEVKRCVVIYGQYQATDGAAATGEMYLLELIGWAVDAMAHMDVVEMVRLYPTLRDFH